VAVRQSIAAQCKLPTFRTGSERYSESALSL
jgi:hypothetical protein